MRSGIKITAVFELAFLAWGLAIAGSPTAPQLHPAGCPLHRQLPKPPAPGKDHSCCQSAPEAAVVERAAIADHDFSRSPLLASNRDPVRSRVSPDWRGHYAAPDPPPSGPPIRI